MDSSDGQMEALASFYLNAHNERDIDYAAKYHLETVNHTLKQSSAKKTINRVVPVLESTVVCPKCGAAMVLRTAKKGEHAGKQFWGCSAFPKCRGVVNLA